MDEGHSKYALPLALSDAVNEAVAEDGSIDQEEFLLKRRGYVLKQVEATD
jgi:hypothetical protein